MTSSRIILADIESTGVGASDMICEIAWHEIGESFDTVRSDCSLINPGMPISSGASGVNGITNDMVADAPGIGEYMAKSGFPLMGEDVVMVAHNASFDRRFLSPYMSEGADTICTLRCARILYPDADNHKQGTLAYYLGLQMDRSKAHSADGDLDVLLQLLMRICRDAGVGILNLIEFQKQPINVRTIGFGKHRGTALKDLDSGYVRWLLNKCENLDPDLRTSLEKL